MLSTRIIPCLDVNLGRVVKGVQFLDLIDAGDPVEQAKSYEKQGADELVFLDITASNENRNILLDVVEKTASECFMPLTVGGGLKNIEDIRILLNSGADKVSLNTSAVVDPNLISKASNKFGNQCIVVAIDAKKVAPNQWMVYTHGGRKSTGRNVLEWAIEAAQKGAGEILLTSMDSDGTKNGYDIELNKAVSEAIDIPIIASGGAGKLEHLSDVILKGKVSAVLAASIFHFGTYSIKEAKSHLRNAGIQVRMLEDMES